LSRLQSAENFAKERHLGNTAIGGTSQYQEHLCAVVARLKNLGITDQDTISAAWLHDILDNTTTSFDEIDQRFGSKVAVMILAISKDKSLPRARQEEQYVKQLRDAPLDAKIIKLCDISANLRELKGSSLSKTRKLKEMKKGLYYLNVIKTDLAKNKTQIPGITSLVNGINDIIGSYGLRQVILQ
jgi:(p)ppGpp synthase/HD superfamily hydrolase